MLFYPATEETLHQHIFFMPVRLFSTARGTFELLRQPMMRRVHAFVFTGVGYFEHFFFFANCDLINSKN